MNSLKHHDENTLTTSMLDFPADVIVETICRCNLRCQMCPYPILTRTKGEMSFHTWKKIVDEVNHISPSSNIWVAIMGEPLLAADSLIEKIKYAYEVGFKNICLNTNAVFLNKKTAKYLLQYELKNITVSVDSIKKETYDKIRIGGDFDAVNENLTHIIDLKKIMKSKTEIITQFIKMDDNEGEADEFKKYWIKKGATVKLRLRLGWGDAVSANDLLDSQSKNRFPCPWLMRTVSIHWDGQFAQCDADYDGKYSPGDLNTSTISEIWTGEISRRVKRHELYDFNFEPCKNCKDWSVGRSEYYKND